LLSSLLLLPYITFVVVRVAHGALYERYILASTIGLVLGIGSVLALLQRRAVVLFALLVLSSVAVREMRFWHHSGVDPRSEITLRDQPANWRRYEDSYTAAGMRSCRSYFAKECSGGVGPACHAQ
jgi:hypothetical protein